MEKTNYSKPVLGHVSGTVCIDRVVYKIVEVDTWNSELFRMFSIYYTIGKTFR